MLTQGLTAAAPEGYRVYTIARFRGNAARHEFEVRAPEGAPVFAQPTTIDADGRAHVTVELRDTLDAWSGEPRFFLRSVEGGAVVGRGRHHDLRLDAPHGDATVDVAFYCDTRDGQLRVVQSPGSERTMAAQELRKQGIRVSIPRGKTVMLRVRSAVDDDQTGPFVQITAPRFFLEPEGGDHRTATYWHPLPAGPYTFRATAADRSGIEKVEFYLNNGRLIGVDTEAPYECVHEIKDRFCQFVYAVAHDKAGNQRRSSDVPFGDGSIGPSQVRRE